MQIMETIRDARSACAAVKGKGRLGLVPTMGALHEGHLSLMRAAKQQCDAVVVSIFVNPSQFGPNEDFQRYPRTFAADCALLEREGVDLLFAPATAEMYPNGLSTAFVEVPEIGARLDGIARPGHFRGVATVVAKLFHIITPDFAYFGQKDAAQVAVLKAIVRELDFPLQLVACPTVREPDGLAMSSRNRYLSNEERTKALVIFRSLDTVRKLASHGIHHIHELRSALRGQLEAEPDLRVEYAELVDPDTLLPASDMTQPVLAAVAAQIGTTRLIDNMLLSAKEVEI